MPIQYTLTVKDDGSAALNKISEKARELADEMDKAGKATNIFGKTTNFLATNVVSAAFQMKDKLVDAFIATGKAMLENYNSATKLSENIGIAANSIIGLRYAAELSSVGAEQMDKNMVQLSKTIAQAASGSKQAGAAFAQMGIDVKNADGSVKNSDQILLEIADAFQNLPPGVQMATVAMDVFGESGASMVSMLKDGSGALREMVDEGKASAGNVEGIAEAMEKLKDAGTRAQVVLTGMIATLADSKPFNVAIGYVSDLAKEWAKFASEHKEAKEQQKEIARLEADGDKATLRMLELKKAEILYSGKSQAEKSKEIAQLAGELAAVQKRLDLGNEELYFYEARAKIIALEKKAKTGSLSANEQGELANYKSQVEAIEAKKNAIENAAKVAAAAAEQEKQAVAKAIADYNKNVAAKEETAKRIAEASKRAADEAQRQAEERIKAEGKEFDDNMKKKEEAMKNLAEFDERMRISSLDGEAQKQAQLLANYQRQRAEIERLHEDSLLYAENEEELRSEHFDRLLELELAYDAECESIRQQAADLEAERIRMKEDEAAAFYAKRMQEEQELREAKIQVTADSLNCMQQLFAGSSKYADLYKASAIGEATINATQSVLKTMASIPYPFNIPLAALQSAVAIQQVSKIASTKMYRGGMIPGMNTLVMANEQGQEAILSVRGVRAAGGVAGVNALNRGTTNNYNNSASSSTIVINTAIMTQKAYRDEIEPVLKRAERRR